MIKKELFGKGKGEDEDEDDHNEEIIEKFDNLHEEASSDEEFSDGEEGAAGARSSRKGSGYLLRS